MRGRQREKKESMHEGKALQGCPITSTPLVVSLPLSSTLALLPSLVLCHLFSHLFILKVLCVACHYQINFTSLA